MPATLVRPRRVEAQATVHSSPHLDIDDYTREESADAAGWLNIDSELCDWLRDPGLLVEPPAEPPSRAIIRLARQWVSDARHFLDAPVMVVPDNCGGIAFEWHADGTFEKLSLLRDGTMKFWRFRNGKVVLTA